MKNIAVSKAINNILMKSSGPIEPLDYPITINFHPDRFTVDKIPILIQIAKDGIIKSQFETKTSNGGLTAYKGGERWHWEQRVFNGAYDDAPDALRPKYGALNFTNSSYGASPRFGSAYFKMKPHILERTTFCYPDSYFEPSSFAVSDRLSPLIKMAQESKLDLLDNYIEAHIHGTLKVLDDVECLYLDPIFKSTEIEAQALRLQIPIKWHDGYELDLEEMQRHPEYRGIEFIQLAKQLTQGSPINSKILGIAINEQGCDEQDIKKIWHYLARFGVKK